MYNQEKLTRLKKMDNLAPEVMKAFWTFDKAAVADGAIPVKYEVTVGTVESRIPATQGNSFVGRFARFNSRATWPRRMGL